MTIYIFDNLPGELHSLGVDHFNPFENVPKSSIITTFHYNNDVSCYVSKILRFLGIVESIAGRDFFVFGSSRVGHEPWR
jgi:hypothetical protein